SRPWRRPPSDRSRAPPRSGRRRTGTVVRSWHRSLSLASNDATPPGGARFFKNPEALQTRSRRSWFLAAPTTRRRNVPLALGFGLGFGFGRLVGLECPQIILQAIETLVPQAAIALQPFVAAADRLRLDPARPALRGAAPRDQAGVLQHLEVPRRRRQADVARRRQCRDRHPSPRQPRQDRPPGRVGEGRKGGAQRVGGLHLQSLL